MGFDRTPPPNWRQEWQDLTSDAKKRYYIKSFMEFKFSPARLWRQANLAMTHKAALFVYTASAIWLWTNREKVSFFLYSLAPTEGQVSKANGQYKWTARIDNDTKRKHFLREYTGGFRTDLYTEPSTLQRVRMQHYGNTNLWSDTLERLDRYERDWVMRRNAPKNAFRLTPNLEQQ